MIEKLHIVGYWSKEREQNCFSILCSPSDRYTSLYKWLNGGKCSAFSVSSDFPWDNIAFSDPWDEQNFLLFYKGDITFETIPGLEYRPLPKIKYMKGVVPVEERVDGQSYLENCGHHHVWKKPSGKRFEDEVAEAATKAIADEIDKEIFNEILKAGK